MAYACDAGDDQPVVMIITNQVEAETVALCEMHFAQFIQATYEALSMGADEPITSVPVEPEPDVPPEPQTAPNVPPGPSVDPVSGDGTDEDDARDASADYAGVPDPLLNKHEIAHRDAAAQVAAARTKPSRARKTAAAK